MPAVLALLLCCFQSQTPVVSVTPKFATQAVSTDADDPAIWVNPRDSAKSVIYGTDKTKAPEGGLYAFDLKGKILQRIENLDRPNNVDVEYGLKAGREKIDVAVVTERIQRRLRVFKIDPQDGRLTDITGSTSVFEGEKGEDAAPMGIGLYRRPKDGAIFAIVTPKAGPRHDHLAQYRLTFNPQTGKVDAKLVRRFGEYSGVKETESVYVDDARGEVYYSDETVGTRKYLADPDAPHANVSLNFFNRQGTLGDHEGIARFGDYVVCTDQIKENSVYRVFRRDGDNTFVGAFSGGADETDGIEICDRPLGKDFPAGIMVVMNSKGRNFLVYDLRDVKRGLRLR